MSRRGPSRRQLRRLLLRAGFQAAPPPRSTFLAILAARLAAYGMDRPKPTVFALPARARRQLPVIAAALTAVAAAVLAAVFSGWFGRGPEQQHLELAAAVDTTVLLPDGTSVTGHTGLALPDGAVVRTGPNGRASAGEVELGPTLEALVDAGHLRLRTADDVVIPASVSAVSSTSTSMTAKPGPTTTTKPGPTTTTTRPSTVTTAKVTLPVTPTTSAKNGKSR